MTKNSWLSTANTKFNQEQVYWQLFRDINAGFWQLLGVPNVAGCEIAKFLI